MGHPATEHNAALQPVAGGEEGATAHTLVVPGPVALSRSEFEHPAQFLVWASFFAFANIVLFRFLSLGVPAVSSLFLATPGVVDTVYAYLCGIFTLGLAVGWGAFDLPAAWRSLAGGSLTVALVRCVLVGVVAGTTLTTVVAGGGAGTWTSFPFLSLLLSIHALLCVWASRVVARHSGVRIGELLGVVNVVPRGAVLGSTETHDKIARVAELQVGDVVRLKRGQIVPCDALVEQGIAEIDERCFSGYAEVRMRGEGQRVFAGSVVRGGEIFARVENLFADAVITNFTDVLDNVLAKNRVPERWESLAHAVVLFIAACAGIHFFRSGAEIGLVGATVGGVLAVSLCVDFLVYLPLLRGIALTRAFERGALCGTPHQLEEVGSVRVVAIDHLSTEQAVPLEIGALTVFDERLDTSRLVSTLLSVLGRTSDPFGIAAVEYLRGKVDEPLLYEVRDFMEYPGKGLSAVVGGAEFSVGTELFLIERGVQIQSSEVAEETEGHPPMYVALGDEVAARFTVLGGMRRDAAAAIDRLHRDGVRVLLMSQEPRETLDPVGKEMTLELGQITGGLSVDQYVDRLKNLGRVALAGTSATPSQVAGAASVYLAKFDEVRFTINPRAVTVFRTGLVPLAELVLLGRRLVGALRWGRWGGVALGIFSLVSAVWFSTPLVAFALALLAPLALVGGTAWLRRVGA